VLGNQHPYRVPFNVMATSVTRQFQESNTLEGACSPNGL